MWWHDLGPHIGFFPPDSGIPKVPVLLENHPEFA
jgi:hypothetical protein